MKTGEVVNIKMFSGGSGYEKMPQWFQPLQNYIGQLLHSQLLEYLNKMKQSLMQVVRHLKCIRCQL